MQTQQKKIFQYITKSLTFYFRLCFFFLKLTINNFLISKKTRWESLSPGSPPHFMPCWLSWCLRRSTLRWKPLEQMSHPNGLKPVCFLLWVMRLELWLNALPHTWHLCGFSPAEVITVFVKELQILFRQNDDNCTISCGCQ